MHYSTVVCKGAVVTNRPVQNTDTVTGFVWRVPVRTASEQEKYLVLSGVCQSGQDQNRKSVWFCLACASQDSIRTGKVSGFVWRVPVRTASEQEKCVVLSGVPVRTASEQEKCLVLTGT